MNQHVFHLNEQIRLLPVVHGSGDFALQVRQTMLQTTFDCLAVPLPESFKELVLPAVTELPKIHVAAMEEPGGEFSYVPIDPCQPVIMGIRIALEEYLPIEFIDMETRRYEPDPFMAPDPYALKKVPLEKYAAAMVPSMQPPPDGSQVEQRIQYMAAELRRLQGYYSRILMFCSVAHWPWLRDAFQSNQPAERQEPFFAPLRCAPVQEKSLAFVLGELPYITYLYEKSRRELLPDENLSIDGVKELMIETRDEWLRKEKPIHNWATPQRLQILLQYIRNLTLMNRRFTPDLFTLAMSAKQVCGDSFAISLVETAKLYPYQHLEKGEGMRFSVDQLQFPDGAGGRAKNRLPGIPMEWRNLPLKRMPEKDKQQQYRQLWNPFGICSWPPEDDRIESFNTHVRDVAQSLIGEGLVHSEKFTTSIKDGLDIRETIRNWHTGDLYVKEIPPSRGRIEVVLFFFDTPADPEKYPMQTTWYAEHEHESTLCFFSTPIGEKFVGPGIAQCMYGGCMFLYPPRYIPDIWLQKRFTKYPTLEERLLAGALFYTEERHVAVVSPCPLQRTWKWLARKYKKKLIHIPLSRFSIQLVDRLRYFHVLNGRHIRSYAAQFIREI